jgi:hypothetical protein
MTQNKFRNKKNLQNTYYDKVYNRGGKATALTLFVINMNSHISYVNEISIKDEKIQQNQRGGNKNFNFF